MSWFSKSLLDQIELGALNSKSDLAGLLRQCLVLGGRARSEALRDWARRELDGYRGADEELPGYRWVTAPLLVDGIHGYTQFRRKQISTMELPEFATDSFAKGLAMTFGVAELERIAAGDESIDLQPAGMDDLTYFMNRSGEYGASIERVYFSVAPVAVHGILDTIRTNLVAMVGEIRAAGVDSTGIPAPAAADGAFNVVIKGRARASIAIGDSASSTMNIEEHSAPKRYPTWLTAPWTLAIGAATLVSGMVGVATWVGWNPFG